MLMRAALRLVLLLAILLAGPAAAADFDHQHKAWSDLLRKHLVVTDGGKASRMRYADLQKDRAALQAYLAGLSQVTEAEFRGWTKPQQLAFLMNAYNAQMVELVLTRYPDIKSVWDFGKLFNNPFKRKFFRLLGREFSLDMIEHETIRAKGAYDDPRIHMAVNCASVGCPMLREEAYTGSRLDQQLDEQVRRFLSDRTRNRYNAQTNTLEVSEIFKWYAVDFTSGLRGIQSREQFFATHAALLADEPAQQDAIRSRKPELRFLDYDWALNDARR